MAEQHTHNEPTRAIARLPGLQIEVIHRRAPDVDAEQISIHLQATPSFEAFGRFLETVNPLTFWAEAARMAWLPWLGAARGFVPGRGDDDTTPRLPGF